MIVCIAEKPSVAREIANVLGAKSQKDGYLEGNGDFRTPLRAEGATRIYADVEELEP